MIIQIECEGLSEKTVKSLVMLRDSNQCSECGSKIKLEVHHLNGKTDYKPNSLITLCIKCHQKAHVGERRIPFIQKLIRDNRISISTDIAPLLGITQPSVSAIFTHINGRRLQRLIQLVQIVNDKIGTHYTVEEMFKIIE